MNLFHPVNLPSASSGCEAKADQNRAYWVGSLVAQEVISDLKELRGEAVLRGTKAFPGVRFGPFGPTIDGARVLESDLWAMPALDGDKRELQGLLDSKDHRKSISLQIDRALERAHCDVIVPTRIDDDGKLLVTIMGRELNRTASGLRRRVDGFEYRSRVAAMKFLGQWL